MAAAAFLVGARVEMQAHMPFIDLCAGAPSTA